MILQDTEPTLSECYDTQIHNNIREIAMTDKRIFVTCLAAYNNGIIHGKWIPVTESLDLLQMEIKKVLSTSPIEDAEEWAIHDHEGFDGINVTESNDLEELCDYVGAIDSSEYESDLITGVMDCRGINALEAIDYIEDHYQGSYTDLEDWAMHFLDETGGLESLPKELSFYFDYEAYAHDQDINGLIFYVTTGKGIHVLWND